MALTAEQLAQLEQALRLRYQALIGEVQEELGEDGEKHLAGLREAGGADWGDASVADALADILVARADRQIGEMRAIEAARVRMKRGEYGVCADCGEAIPFARLLANPAALRCVACQGLYEKTHGVEGTPSL